MKKILALLACLIASCPVFAQSNISLDLKDAPIRSTLEMVFKQGGIKNYVIDNSVSGFVTMNLTEQPFENALKLVMRANTIPLTYKKENDVWIVEQRKISQENNAAPELPSVVSNQRNEIFEVIRLNHIDPLDLQIVFGPILNFNQFSRFRGGMGMMGGGMQGGMGGFGNGMQNGMGGFGGGMMGGGMQGGMMGGMGGIGGGGMGGFGGLGGGRNF